MKRAQTRFDEVGREEAQKDEFQINLLKALACAKLLPCPRLTAQILRHSESTRAQESPMLLIVMMRCGVPQSDDPLNSPFFG